MPVGVVVVVVIGHDGVVVVVVVIGHDGVVVVVAVFGGCCLWQCWCERGLLKLSLFKARIL